jgi:uroporphyrinogen decarboxylase
MRGFEKFFMDLALDPGFACALMDIITEHKMRYWERALETVGENVLVVSEADDLGGQRGPLISIDMYKKLIAPRHKKLFNFIRQKAAGKYYLLYHTCGAVKELLPYLIESGIDILNPLQKSAAGIDYSAIKKEYGQDISFWGAGVDTQRVFDQGTPEEVREDVRSNIEIMAPGGGFVFTPIHNTQASVTPENYMAMWETLQEFGHY